MGGGNLAFSGDIPYNTVKSSLPVSDCGRRKMGEIDLVLNRYFEDGERYADLINGYAFNGDQVVRKEDVQELDPRETGVTGRLGRRPGVQKYRDSIRRVVLGARFVLIGLEHQDQVHYAMPVRVMLQDAAEYDRQLRRIRRVNRRVGGLTGAEFLGGFTSKDRICPVITLVLYYGKKPWDGAMDLHGLMDCAGYPEPMLRLVNNYRLHVLEVRRFVNIRRFRTDLYQVFGFIQRSGDKEAERRFTEENRVYFEGMDEEAFDVITAITGSRELEQVKEQYREEGGRINMCEAIRGMIEDGRIEGRLEGKIEGKYEGALEKTRTVARNMYLRGMSAEDAAAICEMDTAQIEVWFREWGKR